MEINEIEYKIGKGELSAAKVYTLMLQHIKQPNDSKPLNELIELAKKAKVAITKKDYAITWNKLDLIIKGLRDL